MLRSDVLTDVVLWHSMAQEPNHKMSGSMLFDPRLGIVLEVQACDIDVIGGTVAEIRYSAMKSIGYVTSVPAGPDIVHSVAVYNQATDGCDSVPYQMCSSMCHVTIIVPEAEEAELRLSQVPLVHPCVSPCPAHLSIPPPPP